MKLTKSRLQQIINEELEKVITDQRGMLKEQVEYTKKEVRLGTTRGGRPRMGFQYTASFKGSTASGEPARDMIKARASAYRALIVKMATQKRNQRRAARTAKPAPMPTGKGGDSMLAKAKPAGMSTGMIRQRGEQPAAPMPQVKPEAGAPMAARMPVDKPEEKPPAAQRGGKFDGLGTSSILQTLFPNDRPGPAFKKLMKLPIKHPARVAFRKAYGRKDRS